MRKFLAASLTVLALAWQPATAQAKWHEASSKHFVVYSDRGAEQVRIMATKLERFDSALRQLTGRADNSPSPSNRVTIFMVQTQNDVASLFGKGGGYIGGFYSSQAGSSYAIVPPFNVQETGQNGFAEGVLLHEYAHHFASENQSILYPIWLNEGFAEFVSAARFEKNGSIGMGLVAEWRGWELTHSVTVPADMLVDSQAYFNRREVVFDQFYPRAWLLYHMLTFDPDRQGQLVNYARALSSGLSDRDAATQALGDLRQLELDLQQYGRKVSMPYYLIKGETLPAPQIAVRELDEGAAEIMPQWMRLRRGLEDRRAETLVKEVREIASRHPRNAFAQSVLALAEFETEHMDAALSAAEATLAIAPQAVDTLVLRGRILLTKANTNGATAAEWNAVRAAFLRANAIEADNPLALYYYYITYLNQGFKPTGNALLALYRALEIAPFDRHLREEVASTQVSRAQFEDAKATLLMLTRDPHFPKRAARIRGAIEKIEAKNSVGARKILDMSDDEFEKQSKDGPPDTGQGRAAEA